jgi:hypothetical protein
MGRMKSSLGSHWAGTGIAGQTAQQFDDHKIERGGKSYRGIRLSTDQFDSSKEGKKAFEEYCKEQSGEVKVYNIKDLEE